MTGNRRGYLILEAVLLLLLTGIAIASLLTLLQRVLDTQQRATDELDRLGLKQIDSMSCAEASGPHAALIRCETSNGERRLTLDLGVH